MENNQISQLIDYICEGNTTTPGRVLEQLIEQQPTLPRTVKDWPWVAKDVYYKLLKELNAWDKERGKISPLNAWVCEKAVRDAWC